MSLSAKRARNSAVASSWYGVASPSPAVTGSGGYACRCRVARSEKLDWLDQPPLTGSREPDSLPDLTARQIVDLSRATALAACTSV